MRRIMIIVMLVLSTGLFAACSTGGTFSAKSYTESTDGLKGLDVNVRDRMIKIMPSSDDDIHIDCFESEKEYYNLERSGGKLRISYEQNKSWTDFIGTKTNEAYRSIIIRVPDSMLDDIAISTTNDDVVVNEVSVLKNLSITSNGGDVRLVKADAGSSISIENKNGNISGSIIGGYDDFSMDIHIKKGDSNLSSKGGGSKSLEIRNNNGNINISFTS